MTPGIESLARCERQQLRWASILKEARVLRRCFSWRLPSRRSPSHLVVIVGLSGDPEHARAVPALGLDARRCARRAGWGFREDRIVYLAERPEEDRSAPPGNRRRRRFTEHSRRWRRARSEDDVVFVVLIGHGTFDGKVAKFNLPGPDMTPADFAPLLKSLTAKQVVFVNTASSSGAIHRGAVGAGTHDRDRDAHRRGAICDAVRRLLRRCAVRAIPPTRSKRPRARCSRHSMRARLGVARALRAGGHDADRASAARRQRRRAGQPRSASLTAERPDCRGPALGNRRRRGAAGGSEGARALRGAARPRTPRRRLEADEDRDGAGALCGGAREAADRRSRSRASRSGAAEGKQ